MINQKGTRVTDKRYFRLLIQDDFIDALNVLYNAFTSIYKVNPSVGFEVFIHKVDGLSDDHKIGRV